MTDTDRLAELAAAATPGPWGASDYGEWLTNDKRQRFLVIQPSGDTGPRYATEPRGPSDAAFIVALVNAYRDGSLVDDNRELRAALETIATYSTDGVSISVGARDVARAALHPGDGA